MPWGAAIAAVGTVVGASMQANAAGDAADAQERAAAAARGAERQQAEQARQDQAPWRETGSAAQKRLATLLGLGPQGFVPGTGSGKTTTQYRLPTYNEIAGYHTATGGSPDDAAAMYTQYQSLNPKDIYDALKEHGYELPTKMEVQADGQLDPDYGSLNKRFTLADRDADPVYQSGLEFGLKEGEGGINARALAGGMYDSGATLKALTRFGNDYGSTKANESRNRFMSDQDTTFNRLSGVSGTGQTAANQTVASGTASANNVADLFTQSGNARAAGVVGGGNAWGSAGSGINGVVQNYQNNATLQKLLKDRTTNNYITSNSSSGGGWEAGSDWY